MIQARFAGRILDAVLSEQRWFAWSKPGVRRWLTGIDAALLCATVALAIAGIHRFSLHGHGVFTAALLAGAVCILCFVWTPLARFLSIERARDRACDEYLALAREDSPEPDCWPTLAIRHAVSLGDRATAIALSARLRQASLDNARQEVASIERHIDEDESAKTVTWNGSNID
ncbi:hypothetical protein R70006_06236 [Paraburkholderia domus]|uniref:hypothetical protein n=1 Tax=Paraburkholderia domus TaxID=2793075 RepID=UPI0019130BEC|nr:hypothetical protein [Paraburkholderia domus]MBK5052867.1 hypothetical protein [Burkholderia sp. R-70006]CAE6821792.1 hypothetical protein R70006_06236 [Paraburkholderia domus]